MYREMHCQAVMRLPLVLWLVAACQFPVHRGYGAMQPRHDANTVQVLALPTVGDQPEVRALDETMRSQLQKDPRVRITPTNNADWQAACKYLDEHAMDYALQLRVTAGVTQSIDCGGTFTENMKAVVKGGHVETHGDCKVAGPPYARAEVVVKFFASYHCGRDLPLTKKFLQPTPEQTDDVQPLLQARVHEAQQWMIAHLPHYFAPEIELASQATLPIGSDAGVERGEQFELFEGGQSLGYARATRVTASATELEPTFGSTPLATGELALERGRPWLLSIMPLAGVSRMHDAATSERVPSLGLHARLKPFSSGPIAGFGVDGQFGQTSAAALLGPEAGWGLRLDRWLSVQALAGVQLVNLAKTDTPTAVGWAADMLAAMMWTSRYGFVGIEGGYQWSSTMSDVNLRGLLVRASLGMSLGM